MRRLALIVLLAGCAEETAMPPMTYVEVDPFDASCCVPSSDVDSDGWGWVRCEFPQPITVAEGQIPAVDVRARFSDDGAGDEGWRVLFVLDAEER